MHRSTRRLIAALLLSIAALFAFAGCGTEEQSSNQTSTTDPKTTEPVNYDGRWGAEGFEAVITPEIIEIQMVDEETATKGLYWLGTFPVEDGRDVVTSMADTAALEMSLLGSSEKMKLFKIVDDTIQFEMSMMGVTQTITLERQ